MAQRVKATIGSYLVALVMLAVIPLMIIAGLLVWRKSALQRDAFERSLLQTAQALSVAVDRRRPPHPAEREVRRPPRCPRPPTEPVSTVL